MHYSVFAGRMAAIKKVVDLDKQKNESVINFYSDRKGLKPGQRPHRAIRPTQHSHRRGPASQWRNAKVPIQLRQEQEYYTILTITLTMPLLYKLGVLPTSDQKTRNPRVALCVGEKSPDLRFNLYRLIEAHHLGIGVNDANMKCQLVICCRLSDGRRKHDKQVVPLQTIVSCCRLAQCCNPPSYFLDRRQLGRGLAKIARLPRARTREDLSIRR